MSITYAPSESRDIEQRTQSVSQVINPTNGQIPQRIEGINYDMSFYVSVLHL